MNKTKISNRIARLFKLAYSKLFRINDTPQKIAIGLGLGVFFGIMPGTGPLAALFFAFVFRANRASAVLGSVLTNTWLSIPTFLISVKVGSVMTGVNHKDICRGWEVLVKNFKWSRLFELSIYKIIIPVIIGYLLVSLFIGIGAYGITLVTLQHIKRRRNVKIPRNNERF
jgi:hypothetical protein